MHLDSLLKSAKQAEIDDNAEEAYGYHMQISIYHKQRGNETLSKIHKDKAEIYSEDDEQKMRFL